MSWRGWRAWMAVGKGRHGVIHPVGTCVAELGCEETWEGAKGEHVWLRRAGESAPGRGHHSPCSTLEGACAQGSTAAKTPHHGERTAWRRHTAAQPQTRTAAQSARRRRRARRHRARGADAQPSGHRAVGLATLHALQQ